MNTVCDTLKSREIVFHPVPLAQAPQALSLLAELPGLSVTLVDDFTLRVAYDVAEYAIEDIESGLTGQGFHLEGTVLIRLKRALAYHCERVQRRNMGSPEPRTKNYKAFVEAWQHRPHGDHDATPEEWRKYK